MASGICENECRQEAITVDAVAHVDADLGIDCGICVDACPNDAISMRQ